MYRIQLLYKTDCSKNSFASKFLYMRSSITADIFQKASLNSQYLIQKRHKRNTTHERDVLDQCFASHRTALAPLRTRCPLGWDFRPSTKIAKEIALPTFNVTNFWSHPINWSRISPTHILSAFGMDVPRRCMCALKFRLDLLFSFCCVCLPFVEYKANLKQMDEMFTIHLVKICHKAWKKPSERF